MEVQCANDGSEEEHEPRVGGGSLARREEVITLVGGERPVVVLAAAVDELERLLVHQRAQVVALCDLRWREGDE